MFKCIQNLSVFKMCVQKFSEDRLNSQKLIWFYLFEIFSIIYNHISTWFCNFQLSESYYRYVNCWYMPFYIALPLIWSDDERWMMMNCFCGMVDQRKAFSLISSWDYYQRSSPSQISNTPQAGFEPAHNLSSGFVEWSCSVVKTKKQDR